MPSRLVEFGGEGYHFHYVYEGPGRYIVQVQDLVIGGVHDHNQGGWTAVLRPTVATNHSIQVLEGFASRKAATAYIVQSVEVLHKGTYLSLTPNELGKILTDTFTLNKE